ncbi:calcium-binding protein [Pseudodonghicola flavimaris]|uniref:Calcium-binding protein n=1 Tax=Pseudodonghicola flavimaris TaxID=3050036 RepID=A0ABT7F8H8_9RHOB|nr:calcium-binding protein [Pseudodonghicola flavimaris]MDK3020919.1 calcium-binding protein [Pseudodonghicola flavimaris]
MPVNILASGTSTQTLTANNLHLLPEGSSIFPTSGDGIVAITATEPDLTIRGAVTGSTAINYFNVDGGRAFIHIAATGTLDGDEGIRSERFATFIEMAGSITAALRPGINLETPVSGTSRSLFPSAISVSGQIFSEDDGIRLGQENATVTVSGRILATTGIDVSASNTQITNTGEIVGTGFGYGSNSTPFVHFGYAIRGAAALDIVNAGTLSGSAESVVLSTSVDASDRLLNLGLIDGGVALNGGDDRVVNRGTIAGDVALGAGADLYRGRDQGSVDGTINGGSGDDTLIGSNEDDTIDGGTDHDTIRGRGGDDILSGGTGGGDSIFGGSGDDTITAGDGATWISAGAGEDIVDGGAQDDILFGGADDDDIAGNGGADEIRGGAGDDWLTGEAGDDTLIGGRGDDTLSGGNGIDYLSGGSGDDSLNGGGNNDTLDGGAGADTMEGGLGDDTYVVDNTGDTVTEVAGAGYDTVKTTLATFALTFANVENLTGTSGAGQTLTGNALDNEIVGAGGDDVLFGKAGNDWLDGGAGADQMTGGAGNDTYVVDDAGDVVTEAANGGTDLVITDLASFSLTYANVENLMGTSASAQVLGGNALDNMIFGGSNNDALYGGFGNDKLNGGLGNDVLNGGAGDDTMVGGLGDDSYTVDSAGDVVTEDSAAGIDTVRTALSSYSLGTVANVENLIGLSAGGQVLAGNTLDNTITGNAGNDALYGGLGDDTLRGNAGNDAMNGGGGSDTFIFAAGFGHDTVNGFHAGATGDADVISISSGLIADYADLLSHTADAGANTVITVDASNTITLLGVHKADLDVSDFSFF